MNGKFEEMNDKFEEISNTVGAMSQKITKIETTLENETNKKIQLLGEGFQSVTEMSDTVQSLS